MATTKKTTTKKAATAKKSTVAKKSDKTDFSTFTVTGTELASILGLTLPNITQMKLNGNLVPDADGRFNLKDAVSSYCKRMREKRNGGDSKSELELENIALKNEKLKEQLRSWRMQRDREVGLAIIQAVVTAMENLKNECKLVPRLPEAIEEFIGRVNDIDVDQISYLVEGENEEEEDE